MNTEKTRGKSLREISEIIRDHLTQQKARAWDPRLGCRYVTDGGLMCAIGCLLDPGSKASWAEGCARHLAAIHPELEMNRNPESTEARLFTFWQNYHDFLALQPTPLLNHNPYGYWLRTRDPEASPEHFHDHICAKLGLE